MEMERACCANSCFASHIQRFYGRDEMSRGANSSLVAGVKVKAEVFTALPTHTHTQPCIRMLIHGSLELAIVSILRQGVTFRERY